MDGSEEGSGGGTGSSGGVGALTVEPSFFKDISYCICGNIDSQLLRLLETGGGKKTNYAGVGTTHVFAGEGADKLKIEEAQEVFEVPVVSPVWILVCASLKKILPLDGFNAGGNQLFSNVCVTSTGIRKKDLSNIWSMITFFGGKYTQKLTKECTHLITISTSPTPKYLDARKLGLKIVTPDWIYQCVSTNSISEERMFDPELLISPASKEPQNEEVIVKVETKPPNITNALITATEGIKLNDSTPTTATKTTPPVSNILQNKLMSQHQQVRAKAPGDVGVNQVRMIQVNQTRLQQPVLTPTMQQQLQNASTKSSPVVGQSIRLNHPGNESSNLTDGQRYMQWQQKQTPTNVPQSQLQSVQGQQQQVMRSNASPAPLGSQQNTQNQQILAGPQQSPQSSQNQQQMLQGQPQQTQHQMQPQTIQQHNQAQIHPQGNVQQVQMQNSHQIHPVQMSNQQQGTQQQQQLRQMSQIQQPQTFQTMTQMQPPGHIPSQHTQQHQNQQQLQNVQQMHSPQHLQSSQKLQSPQQMQSPGHQQIQSPVHQQLQSPVHQQMQSPVHQHIQSPGHQQILSPSPQQLQNQMSQQMQGQISQPIQNQVGQIPQQMQSHQMQNQSQHMQGQVPQQMQGQLSQQMQGQIPQQMQGHVPQQLQGQVSHQMQTQGQQIQGQIQQQIQIQGQGTHQMQGQVSQHMQNQAGQIPQQMQGQVGQLPQQMQGQVGQLPQQMQGQVGQLPQQMQGQVGQMSQQMQLQVGQLPQQMHGQTGQLSQQLHGQAGQLQGQVGQMPQQLPNQVGQIPQQIQGQVGQLPQQMQGQISQQLQNQLSQSIQNQIPQQMQGQQQLQTQGPQQVQTNQQNQFQQGQIQFQNQNMQQIQFQNQSPVRAQQQRQFNPSQVQSQQQIRVALPVSTQNQQIHFQVVQQQPNRQPMMINQGAPRVQYQSQGNVTSPNNPMNQQVYRQQQPNQIQLFHPIQQGHRMQSPDQQHPGNQIQSNPNQLQQNQGQLHQIPGHYNVVINQFSPNSPNTHQQVNNVNSPQMGQPHQQLSQGGQTVQYARPSPWTPQHSDIVRQAHSDPEFAAKWNNMDPEQRTLFLQQLMQTRKNESMRQEMMQRQQQMQQQSGNPSQSQPLGVGQQPQRPGIGSPQSTMGSSNQNLSLQQNMQTHVVAQTHGDKQLNHINPNSSTSGQVGVVGSIQQTQGPIGSQPQQMILQGHQLQKTSPGITPVQGGVQVQNSPNQQTVLGSQSSPGGTQKFLPPQIQQTRLAPHGYIGSQQGSPQVVGVVRTQIYTPQVGQQQQRVNIRHGIPQQPPGQQARQHLVVQHAGGPGPTKMAIMTPGQQQQQQGHLPQQPSSLQWSPNQRMVSPNQPSQFQNRLQSPEQMNTSPQQSSWNVRPPSQPPLSPSGPQSTMSYVQVVNSKTKTALANLLSNRLQGNAVPESNAVPTTSASTTTPTVLSSTPTTQAMCPPPPPPVTSQSLSQTAPVTAQTNIVLEKRTLANITNGSKTIQVNTFGTSRAPASQIASSPTAPPRPQFYGHDPQLTIPQDKFLLGCVFWQAETSHKINSLNSIISQHGGELVQEYNSATVTHVLCETQAFNEFVQVMRDGKRVVTLHWLNDICARKMLLPPYYAIHLPVPFKRKEDCTDLKRNIPEPPLKDHVFSCTGFNTEDRQRVMQMLKLLGAVYTVHFSSLNTGLVAFRAEGIKYQKAREWKRPVVCLQLLNELMLGHSSGLQMIHSPKYQNFTLDQPFRFDINLALGLMAPWKTPIRPTPEQKLKRRSDSDDGSRSPKQAVMDIDDEVLSPQGIDNEQNNGDLDQEAELSIWKPIVIISGFTILTKEQIKSKIEKLGGKVTTDYKEATHLLVKSNSCTMKLFYAICRMRHIVGISWVVASLAAKKFVDEKAHTAIHTAFELAYNVKLAELMQKPSRRTLFKDITFHITPGIYGVPRQDLVNLIQCAGGTAADVRNWKIRDTLSRYPKKNILITCESDFKICREHLSQARRPHLINIIYEEDIWEWVAIQRVILKSDTIASQKKFGKIAGNLTASLENVPSGSGSAIVSDSKPEETSTLETVSLKEPTPAPSNINGCSSSSSKSNILLPSNSSSSIVPKPSNANQIDSSHIPISTNSLVANNNEATTNSAIPSVSFTGTSSSEVPSVVTRNESSGCEEPMDVEDDASLSQS